MLNFQAMYFLHEQPNRASEEITHQTIWNSMYWWNATAKNMDGTVIWIISMSQILRILAISLTANLSAEILVVGIRQRFSEWMVYFNCVLLMGIFRDGTLARLLIWQSFFAVALSMEISLDGISRASLVWMRCLAIVASMGIFLNGIRLTSYL